MEVVFPLFCNGAFFIVWCAVFVYAIYTSAMKLGVSGMPPMRRRVPVRADVLAPIRQGDPGFTWEAFCARALPVYEVTQRARMVRQPGMARGFVTAELMRGLENAAACAASAGATRSLVPVRVTGIGPVSVGLRGERRTLTVRVVGETSTASRDAVLGGTGMPWDEAYAAATVLIDEMWTFERDMGAQTAPLAAMRACPHCGAPVRDPYSGVCGYCRSALRPGADDWRASRIEPTPGMLTGVAS